MKHLKMLGLVAIAALGLMAFVGVGTATATTLATDPAGKIHYGVGTEIHVTNKSGTSVILEDTSGNTDATCTEATIKGKIEDPWVETAGQKIPSGTWITGPLNALLLAGCNQTSDVVSLGSLEIMQVGSKDEGEVVGKGSEVTLNIFGVSCTYGTGTGTKLGTLTGGEAPEFVVNAALPKTAGGFLCPVSLVLTGAFIFTTPHTAHIVA